jgi:putative addiction module killer protein
MGYRLLEYVEISGGRPYEVWFNHLDPVAATKITTAKERMQAGNLSKVKSVREGVLECVVPFGPGYRIYLGRDDDKLILLGGGTKHRQSADITLAQARWADYKKRR